MDEDVKSGIRKVFEYHTVEGKEFLNAADVMHSMGGYFMALYDNGLMTAEEYKKAGFNLFKWSARKRLEEAFAEVE